MNELHNGIAAIVAQFFGMFCHQEPGSLMAVGELHIPLCPRCLGLHCGFVLSFLIQTMQGLHRQQEWITKSVALALLFSAVTGIHWFLSWTGMLGHDASSRLVTGLVSGSALAVLARAYFDRGIQPGPHGRIQANAIPSLVFVVLVTAGMGSVLLILQSWWLVTTVAVLSLCGSMTIVCTIIYRCIVRRTHVFQITT